MLFIKIANSFTSLIPCLVLPRELRETTERRAKRYRALAAKNSALFLRLSPKKVDLIPEKVVSLPKKVDSDPKMVNLQFLHDYCEKSSEKTVEKTREKTRENILNVIKDNPTITINELAILTGITTKGIEWQLKKLQTQGILSRIGGRKGGHWEIIQKD